MSREYNATNPSGVTNVLKRICVQKNQIGSLTYRNGATIWKIQISGRITSGCLQRFHRSQSRLHHQLKLFMQTETGINADTGCGVSPRHNWDARPMHLSNDLQLFLDEALAIGKRVCGPVL